MIDRDTHDRLSRMTVPEILALENELACCRSANESHWEVNKAQAERIAELEAQLREAMKGE